MSNTNMMNDSIGADDQRAVERRRAATYKLLAELYQEPDDDRLQLLAEAAEMEVSIATDALLEAASDRKPLRLDYAQLFVGPFDLAAPPYESVYIDDETRVMTEATEAVGAEYQQAGVDIGISEPPDHVAAELEFVYLLVETEIAAIEAADFAAAEHYLGRQYDFLVDHLGRWVSELAENMRTHANTEFYRLLGEETQAFVEGDGQLLADRLDRLETTDDDLIAVLAGGETDDGR